MKARLLPLYFIVFILFLTSSVVASSTDTTIYLSSIEKNLESGEVKVYYGVGNTNIARSIKNGTSTISYIHSDHLDSTVLITKPDKIKENSITYYPYGKETTTPSSKTDRLYTNQIKDTSSDLYFYNARYYNPKISHFVSADKAEGPNRYSYVYNNPIMLSDPSGLSADSGGTDAGGYSWIGDLFNSDIPLEHEQLWANAWYKGHPDFTQNGIGSGTTDWLKVNLTYSTYLHEMGQAKKSRKSLSRSCYIGNGDGTFRYGFTDYL